MISFKELSTDWDITTMHDEQIFDGDGGDPPQQKLGKEEVSILDRKVGVTVPRPI